MCHLSHPLHLSTVKYLHVFPDRLTRNQRSPPPSPAKNVHKHTQSRPPPMSSPPSPIFFLRHGARLDQLDAEWHLSSPTPYDPPLTAKGISQAHQTGLAIKRALPTSPTTPGRRLLLHTSPYLRCVQTALTLAAALEEKVLLRIDAWLGEWLTPDYYTDIDPPPPSRQLCAAAVASLRGVRKESVDVDWGWDSLALGGGGEYGEEWGSMHHRFNKGLTKLLQFYEHEGQYSTEKKNGVRGNGDADGGDNGDVDTVLILVTHGAGCNALLGALSRKPVLTDIPISSLSMAVLRPNTPISTSSSSISTFPPPPTTPQFDYELTLQATTSHLTPSTSSPTPSSTHTFSPSTNTTTLPAHSRSPSATRSPLKIDSRIIEYHPVRSRSLSSFSTTTYSDPPYQSAYQPPPPPPTAPANMARHPSLHLRTSGRLFGSASPKSESPRTGLWTPTSPSTLSDDETGEAGEVPMEVGAGIASRRKRAVGLWRSWAGEQNPPSASSTTVRASDGSSRERSLSGA